MATSHYDAIVVGARCAGSPTAMLLARQGHKVLLVDKDHFPSDTLSTQMIHPPGVARLRKWGLLDRLAATGCPPIERYSFDFGPMTLAARPRPIDGTDQGFAPRRTIMDKLLVDAAVEAGAEVREGFCVDELLFEDGRVAGLRGHSHGGQAFSERARVVVGADGRHSLVARAVQPDAYNERPPIECGYYTYWSNLPAGGFDVYIRPPRGWAAIPTHDDLTLLVIGWPHAEFERNKRDVESAYLQSLELAPEFAERVRHATREAPFRGTAVPNYFRKPFGPGWALVGDAGYNKDPVTAWGISDAFRDAGLCTTAIHEWLTGTKTFEEAMRKYQQTRDEDSQAMFELTCNFATLAPPPPEMQLLLGAAAATEDAQVQFVSMMAGTLPVPAFFAAENVAKIMAGRARPEPA
ncbi:MAG TPA: NAD(P)/FAD-dependent oxidoreductase [Vicinamibacterales bacterium]|nr:NAD(P)/FAD-dependent oxidoreductase [Vicinamibacterales bacterium]